MPDLSRRNLIRGAAVVTGAAVAASVSPATAALAEPATRRARHDDLRDIKHVVILMQENRSFDHYFGSLQGRPRLRRPLDHHAARRLVGVAAADHAPGQPVTATQYPWRLSPGDSTPAAQPPSPEVGAQNYGGTDHSWETSTAPGTAA